MATSTRLLGRDTELAYLGDAVARARAGTPTTVILEAEAGLGKSRLVAEALASFRDPEDYVALGHGFELVGGELPYGTAVDTLRSLASDTGLAAIKKAAGPYVGQLATLLPLLGTPPADGTERTQLFPAYVSTIENLAAEHLVWLVIEDLHWVDASSRDLLTYLVRVAQPCRFLAVLIVRTHDPAVADRIGELVTRLMSLDHVSGLTLAPLRSSDSAALVSHLTGGRATAAQIAHIVELAQGNPLVVDRLIATGLDNTRSIPAVVTAPVARQIASLDPPTRNLVQIASLTDGRTPHRLLRQAYHSYAESTGAGGGPDRSPDAFDAAVNRAVDERLLVFEASDGTYTFTHALLRKAVEDVVKPADLIRGHRIWAQLLSRPENHGSSPHLQIAMAHHWAAAGADAEAFDAALTAAEYAARLNAPAEAATLLRRALALWDRVPEPLTRAPQGRDELLCDVVEAYDECGQIELAVDVIDHELTRTATSNDPLRNLHLRCMRTGYAQFVGEPANPALISEAHEHQAAIVAAAPSSLTYFTLRDLGAELWPDEPDASLEACRQSLHIARHLRNPRRLQGAVSQIAFHLINAGELDEALSLVKSAQERARGSDALGFLRMGCWHANVLYNAGQFREAAQVVAAARHQIPDPHVYPSYWTYSCWNLGLPLHALGQWDRVRALQDEAAMTEATELDAVHVLATWVAGFACDVGDWDAADLHAHSLRAEQTTSEDDISYRHDLRTRELEARIAAGRGDNDLARDRCSALIGLSNAEYLGEHWPLALIAASVESDRGAGVHDSSSRNAEGSPEYLDALSSVIERLPRTGAHNAARYLHARADLQRARRKDTHSIWTPVVDAWRAIEHQPQLGWALLRLAGAHATDGERPAVAAPLAEAWEVAQDLGAKPLQEAIIDLARRTRLPLSRSDEAQTLPTTGPLARLTKRELEVLRHVTLGETNDELAAALFISPKTASVHVSRILRKLDVTSRAKATAIAYEHGFLDSH